MPITPEQAKERLDAIIRKARVDLYKPIQIAEVLRRSRLSKDIDILEMETYRNPSCGWRDEVTERLLSKSSTSSARYQHDVWNPSAMPPKCLAVLDAENKRTKGGVERYIYLRFQERQGTVGALIALTNLADPKTFKLEALLELFVTSPGIRRSIDKAYEIVTHSLFETVVTSLRATVKVSVPPQSLGLLREFEDLTRVLLGVDASKAESQIEAHVYRVGVTNAADRGLDMWANFGPAVQVKHLTLDSNLATSIVDQVESDHIVVVCKDSDAGVIETVAKQIGWGRRIRGIVRESDLVSWYERCLRGKFAAQLAVPLMTNLVAGFKAEFPQNNTTAGFLSERGYDIMKADTFWEAGGEDV